MDRHPATGPQVFHAVVRPCAADVFQPLYGVAVQSFNLAKAESQRTIFQRAVPVAVVHVDGQHLDAMLPRIADDLRRRIETHRLGIEQPARECRGIFPLQPARHVDEMREARGVAFGKAIFAETLDLVEAALGEVGIVASLDHPPDHLVLKHLDIPARTEGRHRLAQLVRFLGTELRRIQRDLHRLFLKNGHAQRSPEDLLQFVGRAVLGIGAGKGHRLLARAALEVWVDHVALDRSRPDDRDFDHQIVEFARLQARKHVHLRPAFDLEHAERVPAAQHVVDLRNLLRDGRQFPALAVVQVDQIEAFADAGQHSEREHVDLEDAEFLDVVLVPFDEGAILHCAIADRHRLGQRPLGQDEAADMLRQMTRHADQLLGQLHGSLEMRVSEVEPGVLRAILRDLGLHASPDDWRRWRRRRLR